MKINSNITAYITNNALLSNEKLFAKSTEKLSTGFKINRAGDDPTGYAISGRMREQIKTLEKCDINATTGKSMIESAEAGMVEIEDMLQRMNELAIKAANGTMSFDDRALVQDEIDDLCTEINRICESSELNEQKLLNGGFENTGYSSDKYIRVDYYNDKVSAGTYPVSVSEAYKADKKQLELSVSALGASRVMVFNYPMYGDKDLKDSSGNMIAVTQGVYEDAYGRGSLRIDKDGAQFITVKGDNGEELTFELTKYKMNSKSCYSDGTISLTDDMLSGSGLVSRTYSYRAINDWSDSFNLVLSGKGAMDLQVGPVEEEKISVQIPKMSLSRMDLDKIYVTTEQGATKAIDKVKYAIAYVNSARSKLGAYENRVDHAISFIAASNENLNTAVARIADTDMAMEMTNYANLQILTQAGTSMLAQANQQPQQVLQLLQ